MPRLPAEMVQRLLPLLTHFDPSQQAQGIELARTLGDDALAELAMDQVYHPNLRTIISLRRGLPLPHAQLALPLYTPDLPHLAAHPELTTLGIQGTHRQIHALVLPPLLGVQSLHLSRVALQAPLVAPRLTDLKISSSAGESLALALAQGRLPLLRRLEVIAPTSLMPEALPLQAMPMLESLHLSGHASRIPHNIAELSGLKRLVVDNTRLQVLPAGLGALASLTQLVLASAGIHLLPDTMGRLAGVTRLNLAHNPLAALPEDIGDMAALEWLSVRSTGLTTLPPGITRLSRLGMLDLAGTQLRTLPTEGLEALHSLDITHVPLQTMPPPEALPRLRQVFVSRVQHKKLEDWARDRPRPVHLKMR